MITPGDKLLDLGIGTGLCSALFFKQGLEIYGLDSSDDMLAKCRQKGIATELRKWDLQDTPLPYADAQFDLIVSGGVFHFFEDLQPIFKEVARIIKPHGIFAFINSTIPDDFPIDSYAELSEGGRWIFSFSDHYIGDLLHQNDFRRLKEVKFFLLEEEERDMLLKSYVVQKILNGK